MKQTKMYFCPKCKATNVKKEMNILLAGGAPQQWICKECGFQGYIFPQLEVPEESRTKKSDHGKIV